MNQHSRISLFKNEYEFLSNFYACPIEFEGIIFPSVEHAYVAAKTEDRMIRYKISQIPAIDAGVAKRMGRHIGLRKNWEIKKLRVMESLLRQKFSQEPLKQKLLDSGNKYIEEGNYWHDNYWGVCYCKKCIDIPSENHLGKLLMKIREELYENISSG